MILLLKLYILTYKVFMTTNNSYSFISDKTSFN